ncbi:MAG: hypothetical protein J6W88_04145 [Bacteroidales bacterium]|nr:hypothetical protein [Bacteroidales bacterium]
MNKDKPIVIGERSEVKATMFVLPVLLLFVVWLLLQDLTNVWNWIFAALFLLGTVNAIRDYVLIRKNKVVGTTIVIDTKGVTVERKGTPVRLFSWNLIDSLTIKRTLDFDDWTLRLKQNNRPKPYKYSYQVWYEWGHIVPRKNLWSLKQKVLHFSDGKVQVNYPRTTERWLKIYRLFSPYK